MSWLRESRAHLVLAVPLCLGYVGQELMALVDSAMVGHFSRVALAGFGVANVLLFVLSRFGAGVIMGLDSLVPQALGSGDPARARTLYRSGLRLAMRLGIPLTLAGALVPFVLGSIGVQEDVAEEARIYLYGRLPSLMPYLVFTANASYLQAIGRTRPIVMAVLIGTFVNFLADGLLVFGDGALEWAGLPAIGLPPLGGLGASLSTCIVTIVMTLSLGWSIRRHHVPNAGSANRDDVQRIVRLGMPIGLQLLAEVGIFAIVGVTAGSLGAIPAAAHQVALTIASVTFSIALGMGAATTVRVGHAVGAGDRLAARRAGVLGVEWGAALMCLAGIAFILIPHRLARVFTQDLDVIRAAAPLLAIAALFQLSDSVQAIVAGALRGAGDTRAAFVGNIIGHYGIGVWVALGLGLMADMGAVGLWWGLSAGLTVTAIGLAARFWWLTARPLALS